MCFLDMSKTEKTAQIPKNTTFSFLPQMWVFYPILAKVPKTPFLPKFYRRSLGHFPQNTRKTRFRLFWVHS